MSKTVVSIGYAHSAFIAAVARDAQLGSEFVGLIAQDHPAVFDQTIDRIRRGDTDPLPVELPALTNVAVVAEDAKKAVEQNGYTAMLTDAELSKLRAFSGSQADKAKRKLLEFDPGFTERAGASYAAMYWVKELPNIKAYGC